MRTIIKYSAVIVSPVVGVTLIFSACEAPNDHPAPWSDVAALPSGFTLGAAGTDGLYGIVDAYKIVKFETGEFKGEYVWPENVSLWDMAFSGPTAWVCGSRIIQDEYSVPFLAKRDGGVWRELPCAASGVTAYTKVIPIDGNSAWLKAGGEGGNRLALYSSSGCETFHETSGVGAFAYAPYTGTVFGLYERNKEGPTLIISNDQGRSWVEERVGFRYYGHSVDFGSPTVETGGDKLFVLAETKIRDREIEMVIERSGPPGAGEYVLSYLSFLSPYQQDVYDMAFQDWDDGIVVGPGASVRYDGGGWVQEDAVAWWFWGVTPDPNGGYWGTTASRLLRHP
jgi:hypothetical protein